MAPSISYFKGYLTWRSAFARLLEYEQPIELPCKARESNVGDYKPYVEKIENAPAPRVGPAKPNYENLS